MQGTPFTTIVLTDTTAALNYLPDIAPAFANGNGRHGVGTASIAFDMAPVTRQDDQQRAQLAQWSYEATAYALTDTQLLACLMELHVMNVHDRAMLPVEKSSRYNALLFHASKLQFCHYGEYGKPTSRWIIVAPETTIASTRQNAVTVSRRQR